jgi:hypothetical protein
MDNDDGIGVGHTHIFACQDQHPPKDKARIFACVDHAGQPVEGRVRVGTAQAFDKGADGVEVGIAFFVIEDGTFLDGFFSNLQRT